MEDVAEELQDALDCLVVHKIGFVLTLYRDKSLPPPPKFASIQKEMKDLVDDDDDDDGSDSDEDETNNTPDSSRPPPPPEFTVIS